MQAPRHACLLHENVKVRQAGRQRAMPKEACHATPGQRQPQGTACLLHSSLLTGMKYSRQGGRAREVGRREGGREEGKGEGGGHTGLGR